MALSDHERELLSALEDDLLRDHPDVAASLSAKAHRKVSKQTAILTLSIGLFAGFALLYVGLRVASNLGVVVGVAGWIVLVASLDVGLNSTWRHHSRIEPTSGARRHPLWPEVH
jgi:hypothetical protein